MKPTLNVAVIIYEGVELIDMNRQVDVFLYTNGIIKNRYNIYTIAETKNLVISEGGVVTIMPAFDFTDCPEPDVLIVPGLLDQDLNPTVAKDACLSFIKNIILKEKIILSVCVGLYNVAATGLLSGKNVTTHYLAVASFQKKYTDLHVIKNKRVVSDGNLVSTGGVTSGIDGALHLLEQFDGDTIAQQVADMMVYNRTAPLPPYTLLPPYNW
ncbi:DJ-1/PfpI family protein [Flavobacterium sp. 3HN19-14]|uniref:DJ-1/PfpI family protein n=1 Tax=Flavobacterium sp. 3HN19-14 TaxID=3448133 RepID=UPI003EE202AF